MLAPGYQAVIGDESRYTTERAEFRETSGKGYNAVANPTDIPPLADWIKGQPYAASINKAHAVLVKVTWTALSSSNAGWEVWVVNPIPTGWELYQVR
jgi:hypothetical protein